MSADRPVSLRFTLTLLLFILCLTSPTWADYEAGMEAYQRRDYATALHEWLPLAEQGHAGAQFKLPASTFEAHRSRQLCCHSRR